MPDDRKPRFVLSIAWGTVLLVAAANVHLAAQGTIGSILGTVTDASGAVLPGVAVTARNTGTGALQLTTRKQATLRSRTSKLAISD